MSLQTVRWSELPHDQMLGYGKEGIVLRLSDTTCMKIYSPQKQEQAALEMSNSQRLYEAGFRVARGHELLQVEIDDENALLSRTKKSRKIELYKFPDVKTVLAVTRDYIPGKTFGTYSPSRKELKDLGRYVDRLHTNDFTFTEGRCLDYVSSSTGLFLVDSGSLVHRSEVLDREDLHESFDELSMAYDSRLFHSLEFQLGYDGNMTPFTRANLILFGLQRMLIG